MLDRDTGSLPVTPEQFRREKEFSEDPEKSFEAVFAAIGNSEAKCITLLCLSELPMTAWDLNREFNKAVGGSWQSNNSVQANYCEHTLVPLGLVENMQVTGEESTISSEGYKLTEVGRKFGQPIAAYLVKNSLDFPKSLSGMFAMTGSGFKKSRPIINEVRILTALFESNEVLRTRDIAQRTQVDDVHVGTHLRALKKIGLVNYDFADTDKGEIVRYRISEENKNTKVVSIGGYTVLTRKVWETLKEKREVSIGDIYGLLKDDYPRMREKPLKSVISIILANLSRQGNCRKVNFGYEVLSRAEITELGERLVGEIILPIRNAFSEDRQFFERCGKIDWRRYAPLAALRHKESSCNINRENSSDSKWLIYQYVNENPGARPKDIDIVFGIGKSIYLRSLEKSGLLTKHKEGRIMEYFTRSTNPSETPDPIS